MSSSTGKARQERALTVPTRPAPAEEKKQRQARQHAISHRQNASHVFTINRTTAREGAHQLGADIASLLNPRSAVPSANHSRSASRHPSGEEALPETGRDADRARLESVKKALPVTWDDVRELRRLRQQSEQRLRADLEDMSAQALQGSRQVDSTLFKIQSDMRGATAELDQLRGLAQMTSEALNTFESTTAPSVIQEHKEQISTLRNQYDHIEKNKIGSLEMRLRKARENTATLRERMEVIRGDVRDWEIRDAEELKRSSRRHWLFWTVSGLMLALVVVVLFPKSGQRIAERAIEAARGLNQTELVADERLKPPARVAEQDPRLRIFDEL